MIPNWKNWKNWKIGRLCLPAFSLRFPLPGLSYHVGHHVQFLGYSMDEEVFISQGQHRSKR